MVRNYRESTVYRVPHGDAAPRSPERKAIVKFTEILVQELQGPGCAAVLGLVDARIGAYPAECR
jgi:hypothetical protein